MLLPLMLNDHGHRRPSHRGLHPRLSGKGETLSITPSSRNRPQDTNDDEPEEKHRDGAGWGRPG